MTRRKLMARAISRMKWFDKLEALGMEYEEAVYVFHDKLAPLDEAGRRREFRRIAEERNAAQNSLAQHAEVAPEQHDQHEPFRLKPPPPPKKRFLDNPTDQRRLFSGLDCLAGQEQFFSTDGCDEPNEGVNP